MPDCEGPCADVTLAVPPGVVDVAAVGMNVNVVVAVVECKLTRLGIQISQCNIPTVGLDRAMLRDWTNGAILVPLVVDLHKVKISNK